MPAGNPEAYFNRPQRPGAPGPEMRYQESVRETREGNARLDHFAARGNMAHEIDPSQRTPEHWQDIERFLLRFGTPSNAWRIEERRLQNYQSMQPGPDQRGSLMREPDLETMDSLTGAIDRARMSQLARQGRGGDTELAHVNPSEAEMLRQHGGSGSINPRTGLREFLQEGLGRDSRGRDFGGRDDDRDDDRDGGRSSFESGPGGHGAGVAVGPRGVEGVSGISDRPDRDLGISPNPGGTGNANNAPTGNVGTAGESAASPFERAIAAAANPQNPLGPPTGQNLGVVGTALTAVPGFGPMLALGRMFQALGATPPGEEFEEGGRLNRGGQHRDRLSPPPQQRSAAPVEAARRRWTRPATGPTAPHHLGLDAQMTPLQQRAAVATRGTNMQGPAMLDPAIQKFYRDLTLFDMLTPGNQIAPGAQPLAIEKQYLSQLGRQPGETTESFLDALMGLG